MITYLILTEIVFDFVFIHMETKTKNTSQTYDNETAIYLDYLQILKSILKILLFQQQQRKLDCPTINATHPHKKITPQSHWPAPNPMKCH